MPLRAARQSPALLVAKLMMNDIRAPHRIEAPAHHHVMHGRPAAVQPCGCAVLPQDDVIDFNDGNPNV